MKVRVISPHLDDAVWSASGILAHHDVTVTTICAGIPPRGIEPTPFDRRAGFDSANDAVRERRAEDGRALAIFGAEVRHLAYLDVGYRNGERLDEAVEDELTLADERREVVIGPVGLRHPDHQVIATAFRRGVLARPDLNAWLYEELPYAYVWPEYLAGALALARCGEHTLTRRPGARKEEAVSAYRSQLRGAHREAILAPERYHRLSGWVDL